MNLIIFIDWSWNTLLGIVLFVLALGILVTVHEFGHFIAAKAFKVYVSDFSIGFGPKIVKIKRKSGETKFSLGIFPLGGYCAMYGEDEELPETDVKIGKERSLAGISRWKRLVIMSAGIIMNFVLAYIIFFIACSCFPHYDTYGNVLTYEKSSGEPYSSVFKIEGVDNIEDLVMDGSKDVDLTKTTFYEIGSKTFYYNYDDKGTTDSLIKINLFNLNKETLLPEPIKLTTTEGVFNYSLALDSSNFAIYNTDYSTYFRLYRSEEFSLYDYNETTKEYIKTDKKAYLPIIKENKTFETLNATSNYNDKIEPFNMLVNKVVDDKKTLLKATLQPSFLDNGTLQSSGMHMFQRKYWLGWDSFREAGSLWGRSCSAISNALGRLIIGQGWDQVGGPVAILDATTNVLINNPFYVYLYDWAMISVNLALFNLLPFPGLDGWQIVVEIIEGVVNQIKKNKYNRKKKKEETAVKSKPRVIDIDSGTEVASIKETASVSIGVDDIEVGYQEWKISAKVKSIMSYVGLGLLFLLAAIIFIMDIVKVF